MKSAGVTKSNFIAFTLSKANLPLTQPGIPLVTITIDKDNKFLYYHHSITYCVGWRNTALI